MSELGCERLFIVSAAVFVFGFIFEFTCCEVLLGVVQPIALGCVLHFEFVVFASIIADHNSSQILHVFLRFYYCHDELMEIVDGLIEPLPSPDHGRGLDVNANADKQKSELDI